VSIPIAAVVHGVVDSTFPSRIAAKLIAADNVTFTEAERARIGVLANEVTEELGREVNRIEGQLTGMLAHVEGQHESNLAKLKLAKINLPVIIGCVVGFAVGFLTHFLAG